MTVIIDLDDTLYPEIEFVLSGYKYVSKYISDILKVSQCEIFVDMLKCFLVKDKKHVFDFIIEKWKLDIPVNTLIDMYRYHSPDIDLHDDSLSFLEYLKKRGYKIYLLTDGIPKVQQNKINALGIEQFFENIQINDVTLGEDKTNEKIFRRFIERENISPIKTAFIGDNPVKDIVIPKKLGMKVFIVRRKAGIYMNKKTIVEPDFWVDSLDQIKVILESNSGKN